MYFLLREEPFLNTYLNRTDWNCVIRCLVKFIPQFL